MHYRLTSRLLAALAILWAQPAVAADHVFLVAGLGGEPRFTEEFNGTLTAISSALVGRHHYDLAHVRLILGSSAAPRNTAEENTLENLQREWKHLLENVDESDTFLLILLGHGQSDFVEPKFNLKGLDLGGKTLAAMLESLLCKEKRVILSFPCSGQFSELIAPVAGVSVIASTDGPRQIYYSNMHSYLAKAFVEEWSDQDGDGELSFYELFQYLSGEVDDYYEAQEFVQINNVSLEDNGDGRVTTFADGMDAGDGEVARGRRVCPAPGFVDESLETEEANP